MSLAQQVLPSDIRDIGRFNRPWRNGFIPDHLLLHPVLRYYLSWLYQSPLASPKTYYFQQCNEHIILPCHHAHTETSSIDAEEQKEQIAMWIKPNGLSNPLDWFYHIFTQQFWKGPCITIPWSKAVYSIWNWTKEHVTMLDNNGKNAKISVINRR
jgi:hypothetical protein